VGLLDDAIREHLDLKRRRGADPAEIERAEQEALGPVRRNGLGEDQVPATDAELDPALGSARDEPDEGTASDLVEESYGAEEPGFAAAGSHLDEQEDEEDPFEEDEDLGAGEARVAEEDDPHRTQVMRAVDVPVPEDATAEHDVAAAFADEAEDEDDHKQPSGQKRQGDDGEDVLEETPEFLQDTPDHDRLWFEQRPPRDFDFDG
jgi:hypothetical protein